MKGTIINVITVLTGSSLGLLIGGKFPERIKHIVIQSIGLFTILIGVTMIIKSTKFIEIFLSLILGSITGELLRFDERLENLTLPLLPYKGNKEGGTNHPCEDTNWDFFREHCP